MKNDNELSKKQNGEQGIGIEVTGPVSVTYEGVPYYWTGMMKVAVSFNFHLKAIMNYTTHKSTKI